MSSHHQYWRIGNYIPGYILQWNFIRYSKILLKYIQSVFCRLAAILWLLQCVKIGQGPVSWSHLAMLSLRVHGGRLLSFLHGCRATYKTGNKLREPPRQHDDVIKWKYFPRCWSYVFQVPSDFIFQYIEVNSNESMMTSSNGNFFLVTGLLCGEFTGHRWIPRTKASDAVLWCFFFLSAPE